MARRIARDPIYSGRRFSAETIETCVRWYITYRLSYRDLVAMMAEQGIVVSHTTIMHWVLRYVREYEHRWSRFARSPVRLGAWKRRPCPFVAAGTTFTARWTGTGSPLRRCSAAIEAWRLRRRFSVQRSARTGCPGRRRSTSMATARRIAVCGCWAMRIVVGRVWKCGRAAI